MKRRGEIGTWVVITVVTVLIWVWAAGETRDRKEFQYASIKFEVPRSSEWQIDPPTTTISIKVEGSKLAVQRAEQKLRRPVVLDVPDQAGTHEIDLVDRLQNHPLLRETGVMILSTVPPRVDVTLDEIVRETIPIRPRIPNLQTVGPVVLDPPVAQVLMPRGTRRLYPQTLAIEPFLESTELDELAPEVRHTRTARLKLADGLPAREHIRFEPAEVAVTFTIRSKIQQLQLDLVRVQVTGPNEDWGEYVVELQPKQLRDVTIRTEEDLIRRIDAGEVKVFACLYLSSAEKEAMVKSKPITYFIALMPDDTAMMLEATVGGSDTMPVIDLDIQRVPNGAAE